MHATDEDRQGPHHSATMAKPNASSIAIHTAAEQSGLEAMAAETAITPAAFAPDNEPHGYYWTTSSGVSVLRPHGWFVEQIASTADTVFQDMRERLNKSPTHQNDRVDEINDIIADLITGLDTYLNGRRKLNEMAFERKLKGELDDACYQFCQAAKYWLDATEKAQYAAARGLEINDNDTVRKLTDLSESSAYEGIAIIKAVFHFNSYPINFHPSAWRVANYSARKLTEWYAARRRAQKEKLNNSNTAALIATLNLYTKKDK